MSEKKVLLTTNYGPNDLGWGEDMYDMLKSRLARGHGPFSMNSHCHYFALYLLAENISAPTTVLEHPHWEDFTAELEKGYDYVGIQLKTVHTRKIARMVRHMRENHPDTQIIIGGYGVMPLDNPLPTDTEGDAEYIRENAHHLCREEGVGFMRKLLGDTPIDREITQYQMPMTGFGIDGLGKTQARMPIILVSLGCPNACDFCTTTAFFHNKKHYVAQPDQVYKYIKNYQQRLKTKKIMTTLFDEDIFHNADYVRELGRLLRADKDTWGVRWFGFGSIRSLSQFTPEELRECGVGAIWIGVESFIQDEGTTEDIYGKRRGEDIAKLFKELHAHGIQTTASMIMGFDFHNRENLKEDIDRFVDLKPFMYQMTPLTPCPGTPLYDRMVEEDRIGETYRWEDGHIWKTNSMKYKNLDAEDIRKMYDYAHEQLRDRNGPPLIQMLEGALDTYMTYKDREDEFGAYQAKMAKLGAAASLTYAHAVEKLHTSETVRKRASDLQNRYRNEIGRQPMIVWGLSRLFKRRIKKMSEAPKQEIISDPEPRWSYYHKEGPHDNSVWVRRGRNGKKAVPYKDRHMIALRR